MRILLTSLLAVVALSATAKVHIGADSNRLSLELDGRTIVTTPEEGVWSVATGWDEGWMCDWHHASAERVEQSGEWTILHGKITLPQGELLLRDSYRYRGELLQGVRRYEWRGDVPLEKVTLSVRLAVQGRSLMPCLP